MAGRHAHLRGLATPIHEISGLEAPELPKWTVPKWHEYSNTVKTNNPIRATTPIWGTNTANSKIFHLEHSTFNIMILHTFCSFYNNITSWHEICPYQP